jgi:hypothetical protein
MRVFPISAIAKSTSTTPRSAKQRLRPDVVVDKGVVSVLVAWLLLAVGVGAWRTITSDT